MSAESTPITFAELVSNLLNRVRQSSTDATNIALAKRYLNTALLDMHVGFHETFPWTERRAVLRTRASYSEGTLTCLKGNQFLSGIGTLWDTNDAFGVSNVLQGGTFHIGGTELYTVASVTNDTTLSMTSDYIGENVFGASYTYFEDEYALASDFSRPMDASNFSDVFPITMMPRTQFRRQFVAARNPGKPQFGTIVDAGFDGSSLPVRKIKLYPPPSEAYQIPYRYITSDYAVSAAGASQAHMIADGDEPIVPRPYRHLITLHALSAWYRDRRDDTRSAEYQAMYDNMIQRVANDNEIASPRMTMRPVMSGANRLARRPWSGRGSRRYETGGEFDRMDV